MKNNKIIVGSLLVTLFAGVALALPAEGRAGLRVLSDGAQDFFRQGREGALIVNDGAARYGEATSRNTVFTITTAAAGTTVVAANASPVAAGGATILSLYNPIGSGKNLEVIKVYCNIISGTTAAGGMVFNVASNQNITAVQNNGGSAGVGPIPNFIGAGASVARAFTQTALTGGVGSMTLFRAVNGAVPFAAAAAATTVGLNALDEVEGSIIVPPGGVLTIADVAIGTTVAVQAAMTYREVTP